MQKRTLYITDLDGTLLRADAKLSDFAVNAINRYLKDGGLFTVATARSQQVVAPIVQRLRLRLPLVCSNGATIFDPVAGKTIEVNAIPTHLFPTLSGLFARHGVGGFLYALKDDLLSIFYTQLPRPADRVYRDTRMERYGGRIYPCRDFQDLPQGFQPVYFVAYGPLDLLKGVGTGLQSLPELCGDLYADVYRDYYFMDIHSAAASKKNGMAMVARLTGAEATVAFGDNTNDLDMLETADRAYVPENAIDAAKALADAVLPCCDEDGVARFLAREWGMA